MGHFAVIMLALIGLAVTVFLVVAGFVYGANSRQSKRYRPGRPFEFTPVWYVSARRQRAPSETAGREVAIREMPQDAATRELPLVNHRGETGGASDRW